MLLNRMLKKKIVTNRSRKLQAEPVLVGPGAPRPPPAAEPRPEPPPLRWRGPQGTRNDPDNFGSAAGGFTQAPGGWAGPKLESVEFPAFRWWWGGGAGWWGFQTRTRRISRVRLRGGPSRELSFVGFPRPELGVVSAPL